MVSFVKQISFACLCLCSISMTPAQQSTQELSILKKIREYWKEGDFQLAKKQILSYLEVNPHSQVSEELHLLAADLYLQEGNFKAALSHYDLLDTDSLLEKAFYNRALCLYEEGNLSDLLAGIESASNTLTPEQRSTLSYCIGSLLASRQEFAQAESWLTACLKTPAEKLALPILVQLYKNLGNSTKEAECYLSLACAYPDKSPEFLFTAATLLAHHDPRQALELFEKVLYTSCDKVPLAAYNSLVLRYEQGEFQQVCSLYREYSSLLTPEYQIRAKYLLGSSLHQLDDPNAAISVLTDCIESNQLPLEDRQHVAFLLCQIAYTQGNEALYRETWEKSEPWMDPKLLPEAHLGYIHLLQEQKRLPTLLEQIESFLARHDSHPQSVTLQMLKIRTLYESQEYSKTQDALTQFLASHPNFAFDPQLLRLKLCLATEQNNNSSWIEAAETALTTPDILSLEEKEALLRSKAKYLFSIEKFPQTLNTIEEYCSSFPLKSLSKELAFIRMMSTLHDPSSSALFAEYAEKFLEQYPDTQECTSTRIELFNTYLQLSQQDPKYASKASDHLYTVFLTHPESISSTNLQWLAEYYAQSAQIDAQSRQRAVCILEKIVLSADKDSNQDANLYRLCTLLSDNEKKSSLLRNWALHNTTFQTPIKSQLLFELAEAERSLGQCTQALGFYEILIQAQQGSTLAAKASIQKARILFQLFSPEEKSESNPLYEQMLQDLKEIEIARDPASEPIHLQAAMEYIAYKIAPLTDEKEKQKKKAHLLSLFIETYQTDSRYTTANLQEKWDIVQTYLQCAKQEISRCQADIQE